VTPRENTRAPDVIGVLVGDQDPGEVADIRADRRDAPLDLRTAQAGIDQDAGGAGFEEGAIAGAAAGEDVDLQGKAFALRLSCGYSTPGSGAGARAANRSSISCTMPSTPASLAASLDSSNFW
jgi:hypothetical protein